MADAIPEGKRDLADAVSAVVRTALVTDRAPDEVIIMGSLRPEDGVWTLTVLTPPSHADRLALLHSTVQALVLAMFRPAEGGTEEEGPQEPTAVRH